MYVLFQIVAVCDFYTYVRYIQQGLVKADGKPWKFNSGLLLINVTDILVAVQFYNLEENCMRDCCNTPSLQLVSR